MSSRRHDEIWLTAQRTEAALHPPTLGRAHNRTEQKAPARARAPFSTEVNQARVDLALAAMNKTEARFAQTCALWLAGKEIQWWAFESLKLRLGRGAWYTPDFVTLSSSGALSVYEVKGYWQTAARVRIKVAAALYPWLRFVAVTTEGDGWNYEEIRL